MSVTLLVLLGYVALITAVGLAIGRRVRGTADFFVAGRSMGPWLLFATLLAANIGAGSTVGAASLGYEDGLAAWWWVGSAGIGTLVLAGWLGPKLWRIAKDADLLTVGDYLEHRYGPSVRATVAVLLWFVTLASLAGQLIAMATILQVVAGAPEWLGAVAGGFVMLIYFVAGGLLSSAWVNLVQLVVLFAGFLLAVPLAVQGVGGLDALLQAPAGSPDYLSFWGSGASGWTIVFIVAPAFVVSPGILQKTFGAANEVAVRRGVTACGLVLLAFAFLPPLLGMAARVVAPELDNADLALATVLLEAVPPAVGLLGLAAVLSAEISSADAILFMLATSLSKDLYKRFVNPDASDRQILQVARLSAVAGGLLAMILALTLQSVIQALTVFYAILGVSLFIPVVAGIYTRRPGVPEALAAIGAGVSALVVSALAPDQRWIPGFTPAALGLMASAVGFVLWFVFRRSSLWTEGGKR
ncbi:MAG: sodium:solute symporter family protein [Gemmatimonadetes bacterium]|nr:sodium:solute symporter family protein [Gemmatimonadota bacterium]